MLRAPLNPADLLTIDGRYAFELDRDEPLGAEGVGIVEAVGESVSRIRPGDRVLPLMRGNWCRYRLLDQADLVALPPNIDIDQAAMLRINPPTAHLLLERTGARRGDAIVQNGAGSMVAHWVRFFAAGRGIVVIDVLRRADPELRDAIVDGPDLSGRVKAAAGGAVRAALDCVAGDATGRLAECLSPGGQVMLFGHLSGAPASVRSQVLTGGGLSVIGFSLRPAEVSLGPENVQRMFADILATIASAPPALPVRAAFPLEEAEAAIAAARVRGRGRVLFDLTL